MSYSKILVGTDGSQTAQRAESIAARLAAAMNAELVIASAYSGEPSEADNLLEKAGKAASAFGVRIRTEKFEGTPADGLIDLADKELAELLVVGNKGMDAGRLSLLGNVPNKISHQAGCDLLIVSTSSDVERPDAVYGRVLAATDGSANAGEAARKACRLAESIGASVVLVYVGEPDAGTKILAEAADRLAFTGELQTVTVSGDPAEKIIEVAAGRNASLIVVGNKGMAGAKRLLLGSVPDKISHKALCDVLIARTITKPLADLDPGEGAIVVARGRKMAAFKDPEGEVIALSHRCTHMGCTVDWNADEQTWDCPCHGSRYSYQGEVIEGPAKKNLAKIEL